MGGGQGGATHVEPLAAVRVDPAGARVHQARRIPSGVVGPRELRLRVGLGLPLLRAKMSNKVVSSCNCRTDF